MRRWPFLVQSLGHTADADFGYLQRQVVDTKGRNAVIKKKIKCIVKSQAGSGVEQRKVEITNLCWPGDKKCNDYGVPYQVTTHIDSDISLL